MPPLYQKYSEFPHGVINAIESTEIPFDAVNKSDKFWYRENFWRKIPGLVELNSTVLSDPVWSVFVFNQILPKQSIKLVASGGDIYKYNESAKTLTSVHGGMVANQQVEFLQDGNKVYFGSQQDLWRRYDGEDKTYTIGGANPPKKFSKIIFNPYAGRYFGIGEITNPDYLYWSEHIDDNGIEVWPDANIQIIESVFGDTPKALDIFEGRIIIASDHSINTGTVLGVPENWSFQREKSQAGTVAQRTFKRHGKSFYMLSPEFELYKWPEDQFLSKGRVKFDISPHKAHLAWAEIVEDRYYYLCFQNNLASTTNRYHLWIYDILGDRFYGPHTQFDLVSAFYDHDNRVLLCGGADGLEGYLMEHRGKDIRNSIMNCHWIGSFSDYGFPRVEKHYTKFWIKSKQEGSLPNSEGQLELIVNVDNDHSRNQSQRLVLEDPANQNLSETSKVKDAITKRAHIFDSIGRGNSVQVEIKHAVQSGDFHFTQFEIEYYLKNYKKENRGS